MYLKNLTILGFKSFADKTALTFQPGITCIVGPNGCGKSNVADAIRWVLGEQSAKALRGGEMADVIFTGTDHRKGLAMAEVSLTIGDVEESQLRAAGVEVNFSEVTVTRRVFRDGGSEYFINRTPCRLKDIQQLFMGTGVGRTSYSIMAQGNITQILSSKPEDRRMVFEEAAGIVRFKTQKREALRKLDYTDQNLVRVADLIREVKRQIGSLQRQAGKARRYKQLSQELQHLETQLARHQYDVLQGEIRDRESLVDDLRRRFEEESNRILQDETEIGACRDQLATLEQEIHQERQKGLELRNQAERHENRVQFNRERIQELENQHRSARAEIAIAADRKSAAELELVEIARRLEEAEAAVTHQRSNFDQQTRATRALDEAIGQQQQSLRESQAGLFQVAQQAAKLRNEINAIDLHKQGNLARLDKLSSEKIQLEEERTHLQERLRQYAADVDVEKQQAQARRVTVEERQQQLRLLHRRLEEGGRELETRVQRQAATRSRLNVLEQLQAEHEGFGAGALAALQQTEQVLGSLADRIRVPDQYVVAIETALGHHLQLVLTEEPQAAWQILAALGEQKKGRASIAPLAFHAPDAPDPAPIQSAHGELALTVIEADEIVRPLLRRLLHRTFIVPSLQEATAAWSNGGRDCDYVTPSGELLSRAGVFTGGYLNGSGSGGNPSSILGRRNQITALRAELGQIEQEIATASRERGQLQSEQTALQASLHSDQNDLRNREVAIATHEGEVSALQNSLRILHQKIDTVVYEVQSLAGQEAEGQQKRSALANLLAEAEDRERQLQESLQAVNAAIESLRQRREESATLLTEIRVTLATQQELCDSLRRQQHPLTQRIQEAQEVATRRRAEMETFTQRQAQAHAEIEESRQRIESLQHEREQVGLRTTSLEAQRNELDANLGEREERLREQRRNLTDLQQQRGNLDVELAQKRMNVENLKDRIRQKYQLDLETVRSECITITFADQGPARVQTLSPEEMAAAGGSTDWKAVGDQIAALQQRLDEIGPVNLVAIEEYEETEQRFQFLTQQHDDLVRAKAELLEVINRINTQTKTLFVETFEKIRENFRNMFTEVFGGGKADLRLVDEGDVLECGIDIVARPPGKQLQTISLLSGGEQTMTAVALLFAIYQVKPSPFCVLDELDAPLDESNINRFIRILQRFLAHSQFIIITHNKRTIGMADVLYGVTMQEQGVSTMVSVKFHKASDPVSSTATPLIPPPAGPQVEDEEDAPHAREETLELTPAR